MFTAFKLVYGGLLLSLVLFSTSSVWANPGVELKGLFKGSAVLVVDGEQKLLKQGNSFQGIKLIKATSRFAIVEIEGERQKLTLSKAIGGRYQPAEKTTIRLPSGHNGHYFASGFINGRAVTYMVDTGASSIAMSSRNAKQLGIRYQKGIVVNAATASGVAKGYQINLSKVSVGAITLNNVAAIIVEGDFPREILLGNSFLSRINMSVEQGVLILQSKY